VRLHSMQKRELQGLLFVLPAFMVMALFFLYPMILSFAFSLTDWNGLSMSAAFVGLRNFRAVLHDTSVKQVLFNTFYLVILYVPVLNVMALLVSVGLCSVRRVQDLYKAVLFFPNMLSMAVVSFVWKIIFALDGGLLNTILQRIGLGALVRDWLGTKITVMPAMSTTIIWFALGYYVLIYVAGIKSIPLELYEAAEVDGIGARQRLFRITLPLIAPAVTINIVLSTIGILSLFDLPFVLPRGGPGYYSETLALRIYSYAFVSLRIDYALAMAVILGIIAIAITVLQLRLLQRREHWG